MYESDTLHLLNELLSQSFFYLRIPRRRNRRTWFNPQQARMTWEEPEVSTVKTASDVKTLTKTRLLPVLPSFSLSRQSSSTHRILWMERRWPTLVRKPIKEPINISSLLTQKHSYRSFQARAIRGQTSIRYGSEHLYPPHPSFFFLLPPPLKRSHRRGFLKSTVVSATFTLNKSLTIRYPRSTIRFPAPVRWP